MFLSFLLFAQKVIKKFLILFVEKRTRVKKSGNPNFGGSIFKFGKGQM